MKSVIWLAKARIAREQAIDYIADDNYLAAFSQMDEIAKQTSLLREQPNMGRTGRIKGTRELVIQRTPFIAIYRVQGDVVQIVDFLHGAQNR